jgi:methionyl aminopeptidase
MAVTIKSHSEIELMRKSCKLLAIVHEEMKNALRPGMTTYDINMVGEKTIKKLGCKPNFKNYNGFPSAVCVSVNDEVVHGIPSKKHIINDGDIVSLDAGLIYKGYHSDAARTYAVGNASDEAKKLIEITRQCFFEGIKYAKAGCHLNDISTAIGEYANSFSYGVVEELCGHGIGTSLHEDPEIPNFAQKKKGIRLEPGMTLAIEPMINAGSKEIIWSDDGWTVTTKDGSLSAHYENTVLITDGEPEILTIDN